MRSGICEIFHNFGPADRIHYIPFNYSIFTTECKASVLTVLPMGALIAFGGFKVPCAGLSPANWLRFAHSRSLGPAWPALLSELGLFGTFGPRPRWELALFCIIGPLMHPSPDVPSYPSLGSFCAFLPPRSQLTRQIGFVWRDWPAQARGGRPWKTSRRRSVPNPRAAIRNPQSMNWVCLARLAAIWASVVLMIPPNLKFSSCRPVDDSMYIIPYSAGDFKRNVKTTIMFYVP